MGYATASGLGPVTQVTGIDQSGRRPRSEQSPDTTSAPRSDPMSYHEFLAYLYDHDATRTLAVGLAQAVKETGKAPAARVPAKV